MELYSISSHLSIFIEQMLVSIELNINFSAIVFFLNSL